MNVGKTAGHDNLSAGFKNSRSEPVLTHTGKDITVEPKDSICISEGEKGAALSTSVKPGKPATGGTYTGNIVIHEDFHSKHLKNSRNIYVYLPPGYSEENNKKYPVLYMADGQNVFNAHTAFGGTEWNVDEAAQYLISKQEIEEIIIVAVENTKDRMSEYTHVPDPGHGGGNLDNYGKFLAEEVKPFIDSHYRTSVKAEDTGIMGSSLGGLSSIYLGWSSPEVFGLVGALSPSIWWSNRDIVGRIKNDPSSEGPKKVYIDMGTREGLDNSGNPVDNNTNGIPDTLDDSRAIGEVFLHKGYELGSELFYHEEEGAGHNEASWSRRIDRPLKFLFPRKQQKD